MIRIFKALALVGALVLGGCAGGPTDIREIFKVVTSTYTNPAGPVDIFRVKSVYASALEALDSYRTYCWSKPYSVLMADPVAAPMCRNRRPIVRAAQAVEKKAFAAIVAAETFIVNNPRLSAATLVTAAWTAVTQFQGAVTQAAK